MNRRPWLAHELETLRRDFPHVRTADLARALGRPYGGVAQKAAALGLRKSAEFLASPIAGRLDGVLALDLGTRTGWALWSPGQPIVHGFAEFRPGRFEGAGMRILRFQRWLNELHAGHELAEVYFEEVRRHIGTDAAHVYGGLMGALQAWCETVKLPYAGVPVGTIKRHATGKGNADKAAMIAAVRSWGHPVTDDNEADAIALLRWAIDTQGVNA